MESPEFIQSSLISYMEKHEMKVSHFAEQSGLNSGTLSRILQGRPISFNQLVAITAGMGLPEDTFFSSYVNICIKQPSLRRIGPFLLKCAELNRMDCIHSLASAYWDNLSYVKVLFDYAEDFYAQGNLKAAEVIYEMVSEAEKMQHSERLALCQYRLFDIKLGENLEENLRLAAQFELYISRLDESYQLDALKQLMHVYGSVHKWIKVDELAKLMLDRAKIQYDLQYNTSLRRKEKPLSSRPTYYYILYAYLARSTASEHCGDYNRALHFVDLYSTAGEWIKETDEEAQRFISQFQEWGVANTYLYRLMAGEVGVLNEYADYIASHEDEIYIALQNIIQAANKYRMNVDLVLHRFSAHILPTQQSEYKAMILNERNAQFLNELAVYYFNEKEDYDTALKYVLESFDVSIRINSVKNLINSMSLFEMYREFAGNEARKRFNQLTSEVYKLNAQKIEVSLGPI